MSQFEVVVARRARDSFERAGAALQRRLDRCFDALARNPRRGKNIKALKGILRGQLRYRVGNYRVIYQIDDAATRVTVTDIAHRRDVYE